MRWLSCAWLIAAACGSSEPACDRMGAATNAVCPRAVGGRVVDEEGAALAARTVSVCADQCFFGTTESDGAFTVVPPAAIVVATYALEVHGRPDRATYYTPLPAPMGSAQRPTLTFTMPLPLLPLPASGPELVDQTTLQTVTAGDVTLTIPAATKLLFSVEDFGVAHGHELRTLTIVDPTSMPFVDAADPPRALYALAPFELAFQTSVGVSLRNTSGLVAGATVELQKLRGLVNGAAPAGVFVHAAWAHVTADGLRIETDPEEGLDELTWLAVREVK